MSMLTDYGIIGCFFWIGVTQVFYLIVLLIPLAYTLVSPYQVTNSRFKSILTISKGVRYNITNEALIGACFLPSRLGNMGTSLLSMTSAYKFIYHRLILVGSPIGGRLSDWLVVYFRNRRGGEWYAEDRLRATLPGALLLVPLSALFGGLLTQYVPGTVGLVLNLFCLFMNGIGVKEGKSPYSRFILC